jgi:molecular chaperone GrpE
LHRKDFTVRDDLNIDRQPADEAQANGANAEAQADGTVAPPAEGAGGGGATAADAPRAAQAVAEDVQRLLDEQRDKYLRLAAEFDNYRKRIARERQETAARAQGELMKRFLDSLDDLGRVTAVNPESATAASIIEGVGAVQAKLLRTLAGAGLEVIDPVDMPFNPELHEAVATEPALSREDDHLVARVYQPGYVFQGQLLRPARVVVKQWTDAER